MNRKKLAEDIFLSALKAVSPAVLVPRYLSLSAGKISAGGLTLDLQLIDNIYVIGAGKASASMASEVERILGEKISGGHIVVKYGHSVPLKRIEITEAGHPVPDSNGFAATLRISSIADIAADSDLVICLLSGGGSALLADAPEGVTEDEMRQVNDLLVRCGADIKKINTVRRHLSGIKGGKLAAKVFPATLVNFMLSDVPGDSPEVIASGPSYPDPTTFDDALKVVSEHSLQNELPASVLAWLRKGAEGLVAENPKPGDPLFRKVHNILIGNNRTALEEAAGKAKESGIRTVVIKEGLNEGTAEFAGSAVRMALDLQSDADVVKPACLLFGGETTLKVTGKGKGGRNQHLALACAVHLKGTAGITVLAAGTDGTDGPTDAAGAIVDGNTFGNALKQNIYPDDYLREFDSYTFFSRAGGHIKTGPTLTNVMDIVVIIIE